MLLQANATMLDKSISIAIVLFILSLVSERFITWFKLYFFKPGNTLLGLFDWPNDYSTRSSDPVIENERTRRIILLNIVLSVAIAILAQADLFRIFEKLSPFEGIGWNEYRLSTTKLSLFFGSLPGCILTGLFMSLGSKFWHDLLDLLFYAKRMKEKMADPETYHSQSTLELNKYLSISDLELASAALAGARAKWSQIPGITGMSLGRKNNRYVIEVTSGPGSPLSAIEKELEHTLPSGRTIRFPVERIVATPPVIQGSPGQGIANADRADANGSAGCMVRDRNNQPRLLTCFHAVIDPGNTSYSFKPGGQNKVVSPAKPAVAAGSVVDAIRNDFIDAALVELNEPAQWNNEVPFFGVIRKHRNIYEDPNPNGTQVWVAGATSGTVTGEISALYCDSVFNYRQAGTHKLQNLVALSRNGAKITQPGDSGAPVLDHSGNLLGLVIGADDFRSYMMPITSVFAYLNVTI